LQASARAEDTGVPAKGLTGKAYEGHYFWDTEIYLLPFLTYTSPRIARNLLMFRYNMLPQARARAKQLGHRGAMFPWRTISGEEASAYYAAGTAQYHINADIMYALRKYVQATGDKLFLCDFGRRCSWKRRAYGWTSASTRMQKGENSASTALPGPMNTTQS
jgi:alpha,alpha-trehalose phosphorylase